MTIGNQPLTIDNLATLSLLDPFGGSGHFIVAAFDLLVPMRMEEEGLDVGAAAAAVIRDNLFLLDIDPRCCQVAAFNLLFTAWKRAGYRRDLPVPNIACSGIAVQGQLIDVSAATTPEAKAAQMLTGEIKQMAQAQQLEHPDARVALEEAKTVTLLSDFADSYQGITTGDNPRFIFFF